MPVSIGPELHSNYVDRTFILYMHEELLDMYLHVLKNKKTKISKKQTKSVFIYVSESMHIYIYICTPGVNKI